MIRCKFKVDSIKRQAGDDPEHELHTVEMSAVTSGPNNEENDRFWRFTPSGSLMFDTVNAQAVESLVPGGEYYIDITPALIPEQQEFAKGGI